MLECRWDRDAIDGLLEYIQLYYKALIDVNDEIGIGMAKKGTLFRLYYAKEAVRLRRCNLRLTEFVVHKIIVLSNSL